ncbi:MAG TPA: glycosyltransferase family 9 protein [Bacteroidota bacterium]|nr:glycosyltransferase family 9 protein [Bacteroidota bacterium]
MRGNKLFKFLDYYVGIPLLVGMSFFRTGRKKADLHDIAPRRILLVKFVALGDAVLLVPAIRALRRKFPKTEITFLGTTLTESYLKQFPEYIDRFITVDIGSLMRTPSYLARTVRKIRSLECDFAIDFEQWPRLSAILVTLSGAPIRLGFRTKTQHRDTGFTHVIERDAAIHEVDNFLALAEMMTGEKESRELETKVDEAGLVKAQGFLLRYRGQKKVPLVVVHPGCGGHGFPREWSPKNYADTITKLAADRDLFFVVSGTSSEYQAMNAVCNGVRAQIATYTIQSPDDFAALLSLSSLLISGNNGAMHLAAALQVPQIALHGPTNAQQWGPVNPNAVVIRSTCPQCPCLDLGFEYHRRDGYCMEQIAAEEVYNVARGILGGKEELPR